MYALELYSGIGGFAHALANIAECRITALEQNPNAIATYKHNFPNHNCIRYNLEKFNTSFFSGKHVDFLWLSPPCQPYSEKGNRKDLGDQRANSLLQIITVLESLDSDDFPDHIGLENVKGFADSNAREVFLKMLEKRRYVFQEHLLCPTTFGIPSRRERYYLLASKYPLQPPRLESYSRVLEDFIDKDALDRYGEALYVDESVLRKYRSGMRILDAAERETYTTCFCSGYYKSYMHSGAFLQDEGRVRRFSPEEIVRMLGFNKAFSFPDEIPLKQKWKLSGNSISVFVLEKLLKCYKMS